MNEVKEKIIHEAVILFSTKGYHGTSMRDIMNAAGCTQPTMYYYFGSKQALFKESVLGEFKRMMNSIFSDIDENLSPKEVYVRATIKRKHFSDYQKRVYKLAIEGWYHLLGDKETEDQLCIWVNGVIDKCRDHLRKYISDPVKLETFTALLMNVYLNITEQIVLKDIDISDEDIESRFSLLFQLL